NATNRRGTLAWCAGGTGEWSEQRRGLLSERPLEGGPARSHRGRAKATPALLTARSLDRTRRGTRGSANQTRRMAADRKRTLAWCAGGTGEWSEQRRGLLSERPLDGAPSRSHRGRAKETPALLTARPADRTRTA